MTQKPEYVVADLFSAVDPGVMSKEACAKIYVNHWVWRFPLNDFKKIQVEHLKGKVN
jgi:hypothetical protein